MGLPEQVQEIDDGRVGVTERSTLDPYWHLVAAFGPAPFRFGHSSDYAIRSISLLASKYRGYFGFEELLLGFGLDSILLLNS